MVKFHFRATNINDIVSRVSKLVGGLTTGVGAREIKVNSEQIVVDEYLKAFDRGGFQGNKWRSYKGKVSLIRSEDFMKSFLKKGSNGLETKIVAGKTYLLIRIASGFIHPRMNTEYVVALRQGIDLSEKHSIQLEIGGKVGGISRGGEMELFRKFHQTVVKEAKRVGYT